MMQSQGVLSIERMCQATGVSRAGFYRGWEQKAPDEATMALRDAIQRTSVEHPRYGAAKVAELLRRNGWVVSVTRVQRVRREDNLLAVRRRKFVVVSCGACQSACIARTTTGGLRYYICRCQAQPIYSQHDQRCRSRCIPAQQLDVLVWDDLCQLITQPDYTLVALQRVGGGEWIPQHLQSRKQTLRKAHIAINQQLERLTEAYLMAIIPLQEYQRRRLELEQKARLWRLKRKK